MTNDDLKRFYPVNSNQDKPEGFVRYDKNGNIPGGSSGGAQIEKLDLVVGDPKVIYDTTDGITITSQGQITQSGSTYNVDVEQNIPIIAGEGINIDANEDGKAIVVKSEGGGSGKYQHNINLSYGNIDYTFSFIDGQNTAYTNVLGVKNSLLNLGFTSDNRCLSCCGISDNSGQYLKLMNRCFVSNNYLTMYGRRMTIVDGVISKSAESNALTDNTIVYDVVIAI